MHKKITKILASCISLVLLLCSLTSCRTYGLPKLEETDEGIIYEGNLYVSRVYSPSPFVFYAYDESKKVGWIRSMYGGKVLLCATGQDDDYIVLISATIAPRPPSMWVRQNFVFPKMEDCYIKEIGYRNNGITISVDTFEKQIFKIGDLIDLETSVNLPEGEKSDGYLACILEEYDDFYFAADLFICEQDIYIGISSRHAEKGLETIFYLLKEEYVDIIKQASLATNQTES